MKRVLTLFLMIAIVSCSNKQDAAESVEQPQTEKKVSVRVGFVDEKQYAEEITVYGETAPLWSIDVYPDGAGKIIEKNADMGDNVAQDDVLARLKQDIPGMEFSPSPIEAPRSGIVTACMIEIGSKVNPQMPVYKIANLDTLKIVASVLETDLDRIHVGSICRLSFAGSSSELQAAVSKIWPSIDTRNKTGKIEIIVPNRKHALLTGMTATCRFRFGSEKALTVPLDAVVRNGMRAGIYKIEGGRAKLVSVELGPIQSADIAVYGSLSDGDSIVTYGQNLLREGDKVSVMNDPITE